jgi:hypothetical protein
VVIEAESKAVLNALTERDHEHALKKVRNGGKGAYTWKETTSRLMMGKRPKVSFWPDGSTSPINYG